MIPSATDRFLKELEDWNKTISFALQEMQQYEDQLMELDYHNTIPSITLQKEAFFSNFKILRQRMLQLKRQFRQQEEMLSQMPPMEKEVTGIIRSMQNCLHANMHNLEADYISAKYGFREFYRELSAAEPLKNNSYE